MARGSKKGGGGVEAASEDNPEVTERKRLKNLALTGSLLSATPARASSTLAVSKTVLKHHGKDIVKKSQRKNKYLFSFPGRLGPISGGKIGDLKDLDTKNPILYLDFPQGRMKLFGTIVFPKNRYLTLDFPRGGKNVTSEDYFNNMIVFSDVCWIGTKEENPDEVRLEFPNAMNEGQHEYDFKGGVGSALGTKLDCKQIEELESPNVDMGSAEKKPTDMEITPVKRSMRTVAKKLNFAGSSFGDDSPEDGVKLSAGEENKEPLVTMSDELSGSCSAKSVRQSDNNHGILPQVTIPSLFKKAAGKTEVLRKTTRATGVRKIGGRPNRKEKETELEDDDDDDIEEYSSTRENDNDDDDDEEDDDEEDDEDDEDEEYDDEDDEDWDG